MIIISKMPPYNPSIMATHDQHHNQFYQHTMKFPPILRHRGPSTFRSKPSNLKLTHSSRRCSLSSLSDDSTDCSRIVSGEEEAQMSVSDDSTTKDEIIATISSMHESENAAYNPLTKYDYCPKRSSSNDPSGSLRQYDCNIGNCDCHQTIDERCRAKMLVWAFKMVDFFDIDRSIVSISANYQDRFLATSMGESARRSREVFRITSVTCLYIAIKLYVPHKWNITTQAFAQLCRGSISGENIDTMEMRILFALGWNVNPPIPLAYVEFYLDLIFRTIGRPSRTIKRVSLIDDDDSVVGQHLVLPSLDKEVTTSHVYADHDLFSSMKQNILDVARYQCDNVVQNLAFLQTRYSVIATAALLNAIEGVMNQDPGMSSFYQDCIAMIRDTANVCILAPGYELEEVRCAILSSILTVEASNENTKSLNHEVDSPQSHTYTPISMSAAHPASPASAAITVHLKDRLYDQHDSPRSVLTRVCATHLKNINFV